MTDFAQRSSAPPRPWRVLCIDSSPGDLTALAALVSSVLPDATVDELDLRTVSSMPEADLLVLRSTGDGLVAEALQSVRARGGSAPAIVLGPPLPESEQSSLGDITCVEAPAMHEALPNALSRIAARWSHEDGDPHLAQLWESVRDVRRLIAAGRIARRVKHDINNPLAALLAEAQLLELEDLEDEARESVTRMVDLTRRVIDISRQLEGPKEE